MVVPCSDQKNSNSVFNDAEHFYFNEAFCLVSFFFISTSFESDMTEVTKVTILVTPPNKRTHVQRVEQRISILNGRIEFSRYSK